MNASVSSSSSGYELIWINNEAKLHTSLEVFCL